MNVIKLTVQLFPHFVPTGLFTYGFRNRTFSTFETVSMGIFGACFLYRHGRNFVLRNIKFCNAPKSNIYRVPFKQLQAYLNCVLNTSLINIFLKQKKKPVAHVLKDISLFPQKILTREIFETLSCWELQVSLFLCKKTKKLEGCSIRMMFDVSS